MKALNVMLAVAACSLALSAPVAAEAEDNADFATQCPELSGEYQCYDPRKEERYTLEFSTEWKDGQKLPTYAFARNNKSAGTVIPDGVGRRDSKGREQTFYCKDNSFRMYVRKGDGLITIFNPPNSGNLVIEKRYYFYGEFTGSYQIDCQQI